MRGPGARATQTPMIARLYQTPAALLTLTAFMWGMNAIIGQLAVGEIAPFALVLARWVMVAAVLWPLFGRQVIAHWPALRARPGAGALRHDCLAPVGRV